LGSEAEAMKKNITATMQFKKLPGGEASLGGVGDLFHREAHTTYDKQGTMRQ